MIEILMIIDLIIKKFQNLFKLVIRRKFKIIIYSFIYSLNKKLFKKEKKLLKSDKFICCIIIIFKKIFFYNI